MYDDWVGPYGKGSQRSVNLPTFAHENVRQADALISGFRDFLPPDICNYSLLNKTENTYKNALDKTEN